MYRIKRCKKCNQKLHVHKNNKINRYIVKNRCSHIPDKPLPTKQIKSLTK